MKQKLIVTEPTKYAKQATKRIFKEPELNRLVLLNLTGEMLSSTSSELLKRINDKVEKDPELNEDTIGKISVTELPTVVIPKFYEMLSDYDELMIVGDLDFFVKLTELAEELKTDITLITNLSEFQDMLMKAHTFEEGAVILEMLSSYDVKFKLEKQVKTEEQKDEPQWGKENFTVEDALSLLLGTTLVGALAGDVKPKYMKDKAKEQISPFDIFH